MKSLIVLVVGLLGVGCATVKDICVQLGISKPNTPEQKQKTLRDSVVGEYEWEHEDGITYKDVYLDNGIREVYFNGKKGGEFKWSIVDGEIHVDHGAGSFEVWRINGDRSITLIAIIEDGKRKDIPKTNQRTYKRIK